MITPARYCKVCGKPLQGRRDKKYCNLVCKNQYAADMCALHRNEVQIEMKFLLRNRTILKELLDQESFNKRKIKRTSLEQMGIRSENLTGTYTNKQNKLYHYIFDNFWMEFSDKEVLILKRK